MPNMIEASAGGMMASIQATGKATSTVTMVTTAATRKVLKKTRT